MKEKPRQAAQPLLGFLHDVGMPRCAGFLVAAGICTLEDLFAGVASGEDLPKEMPGEVCFNFPLQGLSRFLFPMPLN